MSVQPKTQENRHTHALSEFPRRTHSFTGFSGPLNTSSTSDTGTQSVRRSQNPSAVRAPANVHHPAQEEDFNPIFPNQPPNYQNNINQQY